MIGIQDHASHQLCCHLGIVSEDPVDLLAGQAGGQVFAAEENPDAPAADRYPAKARLVLLADQRPGEAAIEDLVRLPLQVAKDRVRPRKRCCQFFGGGAAERLLELGLC